MDILLCLKVFCCVMLRLYKVSIIYIYNVVRQDKGPDKCYNRSLVFKLNTKVAIKSVSNPREFVNQQTMSNKTIAQNGNEYTSDVFY